MDALVRDGKVYEFGRFRLDAVRRALTRDDVVVALTPTVFETLLYLIENPGRIVTKDELMDAIWPRKVVEESNISQTIFTLRKALASTGDTDPHIVTQPGQGYRFATPVTIRARHMIGVPLRRDRIARRPLLLAGMAGAVLIGAGLAAVIGFRHQPIVPDRRLVAMGEFENLTGEPLLDRTFAEATRTEMTQSPFLAVLSDRRVRSTLTLMTRPADAPAPEAVLQEVCARNNGLAIIHGALARIGDHYLVTMAADDCGTGEPLATERAEVAGRDDLLPALDRLTGDLRQRLGESAASIRQASVPLVTARTASFEALKAFSQAQYDVAHGQRADAIPLYRHAIDLDPNFAAAEAQLAIILYNLKQIPDATAQISAARRSMGGVDARERLGILAAYNTIVDHDADVDLRIFRTISEVYPNDAESWANLANQETWLGQPEAAIEPGRRAVALEPEVETAYVVLARAYLHAGRFADANTVCQTAIARKVDGDDLHGVLYQIAIAKGDLAAADRELAWAKGKPGEMSMLIEAGQAAYRAGRIRQGTDLFAQAVTLGKSFGLGDFTAAPNARLLYDMGLPDGARASLAAVPPGFDSVDYRFSLAEFGDAATATRLLDADLAKAPRDTLLNQVFGPEMQAALAIRAKRPGDAVRILAPAGPYELRTFDIPYLRGQAYLEAGDGAAAAREFRKILDHPGVESVSVLFPLSHLGLARAAAMRGDRAAALAAYRSFLLEWKEADPDLPLLKSAREDYVRLGSSTRT